MITRANSGSAFKVEDKKSDRHPAYSGTVNVEGVLHFVDLWVKKTETGKTFLSFSFKKRDKQEDAVQPGAVVTPAKANSFDDDIPL